MIDLSQIARHALEAKPYSWAEVPHLFSMTNAEALAASFPRDHFKAVEGRGGEKDFRYEARALIGMGADAASYSEDLSEAWSALANDLLSPAYRVAMSSLTGCDLTTAPMEANAFHYGPGATLGPHVDLSEKLVTHALYFNRSWDREDGGCMTILRSVDPRDIAAEIAPVIGDSVVLVRSENSWHGVSPVVKGCRRSRRSVTITFYRPGSVSSLWPAGDEAPLRRYDASDLETQPMPMASRDWERVSANDEY